MSLLNILSSQVKDPRRLQGQRISMPQALVVVFISHLCGHYSSRKIAFFGKTHESTFTDLLSLKHGIPSHVSFSNLLNRINEQELINAFNSWTKDYVPLEKGEQISGDGKVLASTVANPHSKLQRFTAIVSLFCQKSGLVRSLEAYEQPKGNELNIVRHLIELLQAKGMIFF